MRLIGYKKYTSTLGNEDKMLWYESLKNEPYFSFEKIKYFFWK